MATGNHPTRHGGAFSFDEQYDKYELDDLFHLAYLRDVPAKEARSQTTLVHPDGAMMKMPAFNLNTWVILNAIVDARRKGWTYYMICNALEPVMKVR